MAIYFAWASDSSYNLKGFKSTNGTTWTIGPRGSSNQYHPTLVYNEQFSYMMDYGAPSGLRMFVSTDSGQTYTQQPVNCELNNQDNLTISGNIRLSNGMMTITSGNAGAVYASTQLFGKINETTGALPSRFKNSYSSQMPWASAMHYSPINDLIYIANNSGIYVINGTNGVQVRTYSVAGNAGNGYISFQTFQKNSSIGIVPGGGTNGADLIYAVDQFYGMRKSLDSGANWTVVNNFPSGFTPRYVHVDGSNILATGVAAGDNGKVVFSSNGGANWSTIKSVANIGTDYLLDDIEKIGNTYFVSSSGRVGSYKSTDGGNTWSNVGTITYNSVAYTVVNLEGFASTNSAPTGISLAYAAGSGIAENAAANATVGTLSATDAESNVTSWALVAGAGDTDNASFMIVGAALKLANGVSLDYETKSSYSVRVQATDAGGLSFSQSLSVSVTNVNEAPTDIALSPASIQEGNAVNDVIGTLSGTDVDGLPLTFSVVSGGDKFNISGTSLRASVVFDYEVAQSHSVTIRATDSSGLYFEEALTISVSNNLSDDPVNVAAAGNAVDGRYAISAAANPKQNEVTLNGQALPEGSVVRNSLTGQKFVKIAGNSTAFMEIPLTPPAAWRWDASADSSWAALQAL